LAKPKTKAAVKKKPAKPQARAAAPAKAPKKTATVKTAAKPAKAASAKTAPAKAAPAKQSKVAVKAIASKAPAAPVTAEVKPAVQPRAQEKAELLTLPAARQTEAAAPKPAPAPAPAPAVRKAAVPTAATRADLPPPDGFTLLVDGHFKNQFGDLKGAKAAASELKTRFPMLRIEIYDAANKARLPA
jgi:hypothetical protein